MENPFGDDYAELASIIKARDIRDANHVAAIQSIADSLEGIRNLLAKYIYHFVK